MSIKGIDAQIMVTRPAEFVRDASFQLKGSERMQDYIAVQSKVLDELEKQTVPKSLEAQKVSIQADIEGGAQDSYTPSEGRRKKDEEELLELNDPLVPPGDNIIDIEI